MGNTMAVCVLQYFLKHVEDTEIKTILEHALNSSQKYVQTIKDIFVKEKFPGPPWF